MRTGKINIIVSPELMSRLSEDIVINISMRGNRLAIAKRNDMLTYMEKVIAEKKAADKFRTAETYQTTLNRWRDFLRGDGKHDGRALYWDEMTPRLVCAFAKYLDKRRVGKNTQSFYFRILRATCNSARRNGQAVAENLFTDVYTGKAKTKKRALRMADIRRISAAETISEKESFARDMFVFSFITRGMAMVDIAHLTVSNILNGRLTYKRHKTESVVSMAWIPEMQRIVDRYGKSCQSFLFPIIHNLSSEARDEYKKIQLRINYQLKCLGRRLGLPIPLTMYVARHSWATIAKASGVPTAVISDAMGHASERTTQIYLDSIDEGRIDAANQEIVTRLFSRT